MNQTRLGSLIEALINVVIGFSINFVANMVILPYYGMKTLTASTNFKMGLIYTVISVARSYTIRRRFNAGLHKVALAAAARLTRLERLAK